MRWSECGLAAQESTEKEVNSEWLRLKHQQQETISSRQAWPARGNWQLLSFHGRTAAVDEGCEASLGPDGEHGMTMAKHYSILHSQTNTGHRHPIFRSLQS
jgi:hypothetical protein